MPLRCRRTNNCVEIWCLVALGGVDIWVSWPSFQKSNIGWPQQPLAEKVLKSVKNWIFDDEFHKNWQLLKPLGTIFQHNYWFFYTSEAFTLARFNMRHPVGISKTAKNYLTSYVNVPFTYDLHRKPTRSKRNLDFNFLLMLPRWQASLCLDR